MREEERERDAVCCLLSAAHRSDAADAELSVRAHKREREAGERQWKRGRASKSRSAFVLAAIARPTVLSYSYSHDVIKATASPCTSALRWPCCPLSPVSVAAPCHLSFCLSHCLNLQHHLPPSAPNFHFHLQPPPPLRLQLNQRSHLLVVDAVRVTGCV